MPKLCIFAISLLLVLTYRAEAERPAVVQPQQVDEIVDHLLGSLSDYVFPEIAEKLQSEIRDHRSEYRAISDPDALAAKLTEDLRAVGHDHHLRRSKNTRMPSISQMGAASEAPAACPEILAILIWLTSHLI
jgi:hypothetical protein